MSGSRELGGRVAEARGKFEAAREAVAAASAANARGEHFGDLHEAAAIAVLGPSS